MWPVTLSARPLGFMGTGAALMRRDGGVEGLILEKVNGLPLDKRYVPVRDLPGSLPILALNARLAQASSFHDMCRLWKDEKWADAVYTMTLLKQARSP